MKKNTKEKTTYLKRYYLKQRRNHLRKWEIVNKWGIFVGFLTGNYDKGEIQQRAQLIDKTYRPTGKWTYDYTIKGGKWGLKQ